ncbi:MAG: prolyl oligopeptidase family serine peptidase [Bowdeniella nasicola]|nr:prolyl oligopeptidase family serine peptidase [Bowdeniella nasicola]
MHETSTPAASNRSGDIFSSLHTFVSTPRLTALVATRGDHPRIVASLCALNDAQNAYSTRLVELDTDGSGATTLTRSHEGENLVALGERGEVYFTSKRRDEGGDDDLETAVWMLPPRGEARVVLRRPGGIDALSCKGGTLFITAQQLPSCDDEATHREVMKARKDTNVSAILYEDFHTRYWDHDLGPTAPRVFTANVPPLDVPQVEIPASKDEETTENDSGEISLTALPKTPGLLQQLSVSDDGRTLLATVMELRAGTTQRSSVYRWRKGEADWQPFALAPAISGESGDQLMSCAAGAISPSGKRALIVVDTGNFDGAPFTCWLEVADLTSGKRRRIAPDFSDWPKSHCWLDDDTVIFDADRTGRASLYRARLSEDGDEVRLVTDDDYTYRLADPINDHEVAALRSSITTPPVAVAVDTSDGRVRELTQITPTITPAGRLTEVEATAQDGTALRAWLLLPAEIPTGGAPLATFVHGGPWGSWNDWTWRWNPGPFVNRGYAVLLPDPAISTGYGQAMIDRGNDELGGAPYTDLLALIAATEAREDIDSSRTALLGGSYGGYMANWMAGHTGKKFRCIVTHASLWNLDAMGRTTDNGVWHEWTNPTQEKIYSPHRFAGQIAVPMLVIHGDKDYRVPLGQGRALWHALLRDSKARGHKFLYYPDENHWISTPNNSALWYETVLAFLDHHVREQPWQRPRLLG